MSRSAYYAISKVADTTSYLTGQLWAYLLYVLYGKEVSAKFDTEEEFFQETINYRLIDYLDLYKPFLIQDKEIHTLEDIIVMSLEKELGSSLKEYQAKKELGDNNVVRYVEDLLDETPEIKRENCYARIEGLAKSSELMAMEWSPHKRGNA